MRDLLSLTIGQPLAGQIRSRRICHSLAALLQLELFRLILIIKKPGSSPAIGIVYPAKDNYSNKL
jgi:hypothetical protein